MSTYHKNSYHVADPSHWPAVGSLALFLVMFGAASWLHELDFGPYVFGAGILTLVVMLFGWFHTVIHESLEGLYNRQVDQSFRWGMIWFIFSEIMFFGVLFGALFYVRIWALPWLSGGEGFQLTNYLLWPSFQAHWPLLHTPNPALFPGPKSIMDTWGIPALNTLILLSSGVTITVAHWALLKNNRPLLIIFLLLTVLLGITFLCCQAHEYTLAYTRDGLTLHSGIYGTTFFMLTGFHGLHVTIGTIMLLTIWLRCARGHFTPDHHFAFEAAAWYWHFVDVVWLFLFVFVYWL